MNLREAAMQALLAIEEGRSFYHLDNVVAPALRLALADDKPYAWMSVGGAIFRNKGSEDDVPLYTHP